MSLTAQLAAQIVALPGVRESTSRFGRSGCIGWFVAGREFAHLHADDLLDLSLPRKVQVSVKGDSRAHFRQSRSEWLELEFHDPHDIEFLIPLVRHAWAAARQHNALQHLRSSPCALPAGRSAVAGTKGLACCAVHT